MIDVAVVCHQGLGTSLWLKIQVEKIVNEKSLPIMVYQTDVDGLAGKYPHVAIGIEYLGEKISQYSQSTIVIDNILDNQLEEKFLSNKFVKDLMGS